MSSSININHKKVHSSNHGNHHWWLQRITAIALIPLTVWFVCSMYGLITTDGNNFASSPFNFIFLITFILVGLVHGKLGIQTIIEDYIHCNCLKYSLLIFVNLLVALTLIASVFSIFVIFLLLF